MSFAYARWSCYAAIARALACDEQKCGGGALQNETATIGADFVVPNIWAMELTQCMGPQ